MTLSELISALQFMEGQKGDVEVLVKQDGHWNSPAPGFERNQDGSWFIALGSTGVIG